MNKLLPCPFCGGSKNVQLETDFRPERTKCNWSARVICLDCFGTVQTRGFEWTKEAAENEAIAAWNNRADAVPVVRCKECEYYNTTGCSKGFGWCERADRGVSDDFYCANGAKMEG